MTSLLTRHLRRHIIMVIALGGLCCGATTATAINISISPSSPAVGATVTFTATGCPDCTDYWWEFDRIGDTSYSDGGSGYTLKKKFPLPGTYWARVTGDTGASQNKQFTVIANNFTVNIVPSAGCAVIAGDGGVDAVEADGIACAGGMAATNPRCTEQFKNSAIASLKVVPEAGYVFTGWTVNGGQITMASAETLFLTTMPVLAQNGDWVTPFTGNIADCQASCLNVTFVEDPSQQYGFDDYTYHHPSSWKSKIMLANEGVDVNEPWKSLEVGNSDRVQSQIDPASEVSSIRFATNNSSLLQIQPKQAQSAQQSLTLTAFEEGRAELRAESPPTSLATAQIRAFQRRKNLDFTVVIQPVRLPGEEPFSAFSSETDILDFLNKVYNQAVVYCKAVNILPELEYDYDLADHNGRLTLDDGEIEPKALIAGSQFSDQYTRYLFLVKQPILLPGSSDGVIPSMDACGSDWNAPYVFLSLGCSPTDLRLPTAHELGHSLFGLKHPNNGYIDGDQEDTVNVMYGKDLNGGNQFRLRVWQWELIHSLK